MRLKTCTWFMLYAYDTFSSLAANGLQGGEFGSFLEHAFSPNRNSIQIYPQVGIYMGRKGIRGDLFGGGRRCCRATA
jgi:hypothetical protein